jgi:hypothetical protein
MIRAMRVSWFPPARNTSSAYTGTRIHSILVPTLCVGTPLLTLCVSYVVAAYSQSTITGTSAGNVA